MLRIAYTMEFLIAIIAIFAFWSEVGGQGHLDLMAWYWKLGFSLAAAVVCLKLTAAMLEKQGIWSKSALRWLLALLLLAAGAGAVTYFYHLNEPADTDDSDAVYSSSLRRRMLTPERRSILKDVLHGELNLPVWHRRAGDSSKRAGSQRSARVRELRRVKRVKELRPE